MRLPKRKRINIFQEKLIFKVGTDPAIVYSAGHFGDGKAERNAPPTLEVLEPDENLNDLEVGNDCAISRYQEYGIEENASPDGYDACDFDNATNDELPNHALYRLYDVFIRKPPNPQSSRQFYVMHDFNYGPDNAIVVQPNRFTVVVILNVYITQCRYYFPKVIPLLAHVPDATPIPSSPRI